MSDVVDFEAGNLEALVMEWLYFQKVKLSDIPQKIRIKHSSMYGFSFIAARERRQVKRYIEDMTLLLEDALYAQETSHWNFPYLVDDLEAMAWAASDYFTGEKIFDDFFEKHEETIKCLRKNR